MKTCSKCKVNKDVTEFHKNCETRDGLRPDCKECANAYSKRYRASLPPGYNAAQQREHVKRHPEKAALRSLKRKEQRRKSSAAKSDLLRPLKGQPCLDCGGIFPAIVMDFDHRDPKNKLIDVSHMVAGPEFTMQEIYEEIAKCDLVCANCHRVRTFKRTHSKDCETCRVFGGIDFQI